MPIGVGVVGCGNISDVYLRTLSKSDAIHLVSVCDVIHERAETVGTSYGVTHFGGLEDFLEDPRVEIVVNLTVPSAHFGVTRRAISLGKHVYSEKPLALSFAEGQSLVSEAYAAGLRLGCAPDTVLGAGIQTCREIIESGGMGQIVGAAAHMMCPGHESWHPDPGFYYKRGGGPMFDMGPYYLTALHTLLGPAVSVMAMTSLLRTTRTISSEPRRGQSISVDVPTHIAGLLKFENGAIGQITTSFDVCAHSFPPIEVYGTEGSLRVPDPNGFGGTPQFCPKGGDWSNVEANRPYAAESRGLGVIDMAYAIAEGRPHRANGDIALHVLEMMEGFHLSAQTHSETDLTTSPERAEPMSLTSW